MPDKKIKIGILGSTGSIGKNALEVISNLIKNEIDLEVIFLTTNNRTDILAEQIVQFHPKSVFINSKEKYTEFKSQYDHNNLEILNGYERLSELIKRDNYNILLNSLVGFEGLIPTIEGITAGKRIALANKETMVVAGNIVNKLLRENGTELIPIDSEHSAILQCIAGEKHEFISKLILTASGGPFLNKTREEMDNSTVENALKHPNWNMGNKITIDSSTLINKGLELIEARWLFNLCPENIEVLIHPQSIIHSMVEFKDGSIKAQLGVPDMKIPIQYALTYPNRVESEFTRIDFKKYNQLTFFEPDINKFECLKLSYLALKEGGTYPVVLNAANEIAVQMFLNEKIKFKDITDIIKKSMDEHEKIDTCDIEQIIDIDRKTRERIIYEYKNF